MYCKRNDIQEFATVALTRTSAAAHINLVDHSYYLSKIERIEHQDFVSVIGSASIAFISQIN